MYVLLLFLRQKVHIKFKIIRIIRISSKMLSKYYFKNKGQLEYISIMFFKLSNFKIASSDLSSMFSYKSDIKLNKKSWGNY